MPTRKQLTLEERQIIIDLYERDKKSYGEIGKIVSRSRYTVRKVIQRKISENRVENKPRSGRPAKLTDHDKRYIKRCIDKNPFTSARKISDDLEKYQNKKVSPDTVRRCLHSQGLKSCTPRKKPFINTVNRKKRIEFARTYLDKPQDFWDTVIFTDESKYNIFGSDGRLKVWRREGEELNPKNTIKTVKHGGGGVMVWGCMSASGVGNLVFIENTMNQYVYLDILKNNLKESAQKMGLAENFYFQQDNDPKHTAHKVKMWLLFNTPHMLVTPPQSPDLNPIEHLWEVLEKKVRQHEIRSKTQLKTVLLEEWGKIGPETTKNLVNSMKKRLKAVLDKKGYPTKY